MNKLIIVLVLITSTHLYAQQKYYKWTDAQGNIHYSATKPENQSSSELKIKTSQSESMITSNKPEDKKSSLKSMDERIAEHYKKKKEKKEASNKNNKRCKVAKGLYAKYNQIGRFSKTNYETGEKTFLSDEKRQLILKKTKKAIKRNCI